MLLLKKNKRQLERDRMQELNLQFAIFFKDRIKRPDELWYSFSDKIKDIVTDVPTIIPVPEEAPAEIPIVQTKSEDGHYNINISRGRADFIIKLLDSEMPITIEKRRELFELFLEEICIKNEISRVGIIENVVLGEVFPGAKKINEKYFKGTQSDAIELSFRKNIHIKIGKTVCNSVTEIASVPITNKSGELEDGFVRASRDINSLNTNITLEKEEAQKILKYALDEFTEQSFKELV